MKTEIKIPYTMTIRSARAGGFVVTADEQPNAFGLEYAGPLTDCLRFIEMAFQPPMVVDPGKVSPEELAKLRAMPAGAVTYVPADGRPGGPAWGYLEALVDFWRRVESGSGGDVEIIAPWKKRMIDLISEGPRAKQRPVDPETDLDDVLDSYRLAGKACGVQVWAVDSVAVWTGCQTIPHQFPSVTLECRGPNALADAAKWLREQLDGK